MTKLNTNPGARHPRPCAQEVLREHGRQEDAGAPAPWQQQRPPTGRDLRGVQGDGHADAARPRPLRILRPRPALQGIVCELANSPFLEEIERLESFLGQISFVK